MGIYRKTNTTAGWNSAQPMVRVVGVNNKLKLINYPYVFLDGVDDFIAITHAGTLEPQSFTFFTRLYFDPTENAGKIAGIGNTNRGSTASDGGWAILVDDRAGFDNQLRLILNRSAANGGSIIDIGADDAMPTAGWYDVFFDYASSVAEGVTAHLYIGGVMVGNQTNADRQFRASGNSVLLGTLATTQAWFLKGNQADTRMFSRVLSAAERATICSGEEVTANIEGWWPINEGTGTTITDISGKGLSGTMSGGTWQTPRYKGSWQNIEGNGYAILQPIDLNTITNVYDSLAEWIATLPIDTGLTVHQAAKEQTQETLTLFLGGATGGEYDLSNGFKSVTLNYDATSADIQSALSQLYRQAQVLGTGDGTEQTYQATYSPIEADSELVFWNKLVRVKDTDYTINYNTGAVTATVTDTEDISIRYNPAVGVAVDTDFTVKFPAKFYPSDLVADFGGLTGATDPALTRTVGEAWQAATSGQPIPGVTGGDDLTGKYLWTRLTLETADEEETPEVSSLTEKIQQLVEIAGKAVTTAIGRGRVQVRQNIAGKAITTTEALGKVQVYQHLIGSSKTTTKASGIAQIYQYLIGKAKTVVTGKGRIQVIQKIQGKALTNTVNKGRIQVSQNITGSAKTTAKASGRIQVAAYIMGKAKTTSKGRGIIILPVRIAGRARTTSRATGRAIIPAYLKGKAVTISMGRGRLSVAEIYDIVMLWSAMPETSLKWAAKPEFELDWKAIRELEMLFKYRG